MKTYEYCNFNISEECGFVINPHISHFNGEMPTQYPITDLKINVNGIFYLRKFSQTHHLLTVKEK